MAAPVLVVDHEAMARRSLVRALERGGVGAVAAADGREALEKLRELGSTVMFAGVDVAALDDFALVRSIRRDAPETAVIVFGDSVRDDRAEGARRAGATDVLATPVTQAELQRVLAALARPAVEPDARGTMITADARMDLVMALAHRVAATDATVLIEGETGTGKELLARAIHRASRRAAGPFVAVNCAALPETLIESELYGHEKGSFTGAVGRRAGRFEVASGGTLLLDEVSEIPLTLQAKLLRTLQEGEVVRVGSSHPITVNVRVIAVTNRDLRREVAEGRFRQDLFYRLNVVTLRPPALRERTRDIVLLARHFIAKYAALYGSPAERLCEAALERLLAHSWPGNVRELENAIQRAVILATGPDIPAEVIELDEPDRYDVDAHGRTIREIQRDLILSTLERMHGNRTHTAKALGVTVRTIRNQLRKLRPVDDAPVARPLATGG